MWEEHFNSDWFKETCRGLPKDFVLIALLLFSDAYVIIPITDIVTVLIRSLLTQFAGQLVHNIQVSLCNLSARVQDQKNATIELAFLPVLENCIFAKNMRI